MTKDLDAERAIGICWMMRRAIASLGVLAAVSSAAGLVSCDDAPTPPVVALSDSARARLIEINAPTTAMAPGETIRFTATVRDSAGTPVEGLRVQWSTPDINLLAIDASGLAVALAGPATGHIVARFGTLQATRNVTIVKPILAYVWPDTNVLYAGMTRTLVTRLDRAQNVPETVAASSWRSLDPSVVTVDGSGNVVAVAAGHTRVVATFDQRAPDTAEVFVLAPLPPFEFAAVAGQGPSSLTNGGMGLRGCGILTDGRLFCWGEPVAGQQGPFDRCEFTIKTGETSYTFVRFRCGEIPRPVLPAVRFKALNESCALSVEGVAYCWGSAGLVPVDSPERFKAIARAQSGAQCALRTDGALFCWGNNLAGDAGAPLETTTVANPRRVGTISLVSLSPSSGCGLAADSTAYCWGSYVGEAVPACGRPCSPTPVQIGTTRWAAVTGGQTHCLQSTTGRAYCFGYGGGSPAYVSSPTLVADEPVTFGDLSYPFITLLSNSAGDVVSVSPGTGLAWSLRAFDVGGMKLKQLSFECGIATDAKAYCFDLLRHTIKKIPGQ